MLNRAAKNKPEAMRRLGEKAIRMAQRLRGVNDARTGFPDQIVDPERCADFQRAFTGESQTFGPVAHPTGIRAARAAIGEAFA